MPSNAGEVGGVDEEFALGHPHRQNLGDVVIGNGVAITLPVDETVDAAHAIGDPRGVVGMARQGDQLVFLLGEAIERAGRVDAPPPAIHDAVEPVAELGAQVVQVAERASIEEGTLELPEAPLRPRLGIRIAAHRPRPELVMCGEGEKAGVVDRLLALPAQHDRLLAVVGRDLGARREALEGTHVPVHQGMEVAAQEDVEVLPRAVDQDVREGLHDQARAAGEGDLVRRPIALPHLARTVGGRGETRLRLPGRPPRADVLLDRGIAAGEALAGQDLEHAPSGDVGILVEELSHPVITALGARSVLHPGAVRTRAPPSLPRPGCHVATAPARSRPARPEGPAVPAPAPPRRDARPGAAAGPAMRWAVCTAVRRPGAGFYVSNGEKEMSEAKSRIVSAMALARSRWGVQE
jgi:hypothetical protein